MRKALGVLSMTLVATALIAGAAAAKDGVSNPLVKARMDHMQKIKSQMGRLVSMAEGKTSFDPRGAEAAAAVLSALSIEIPQEFEPAETDPVSEALPAIWSDFEGFSAKADALFQAAQAIDTSGADALAASVKNAAASCISCHDSYRK